MNYDEALTSHLTCHQNDSQYTQNGYVWKKCLVTYQTDLCIILIDIN